MDPIYKLFTGNHIDLSKIVDVKLWALWGNSPDAQIVFFIHFQLMDNPVRYEYHGDFFKEKPNIDQSQKSSYYRDSENYEIIPELRHLLPDTYTTQQMCQLAETELQKLYDNFIEDWKKFKATQPQ